MPGITTLPGIAGNDLNRCEIPALQRKDLERTAKEEPCSLRTVGYGWVGICGVSSEKGLR